MCLIFPLVLLVVLVPSEYRVYLGQATVLVYGCCTDHRQADSLAGSSQATACGAVLGPYCLDRMGSAAQYAAGCCSTRRLCHLGQQDCLWSSISLGVNASYATPELAAPRIMMRLLTVLS